MRWLDQSQPTVEALQSFALRILDFIHMYTKTETINKSVSEIIYIFVLSCGGEIKKKKININWKKDRQLIWVCFIVDLERANIAKKI